MTLPLFDYHEPASLTEACQMLQAFGGKAAVLAGGTDLLVKMKNRESSPRNLVSVSEIAEMRRIDFFGKLKSLGACCTVSRIAESADVRSRFPALATAAEQLGSPAVRNLGTVGGNAVTASPAADLPPPLIAYGAKVRLVCQDGERVLPLERFFEGPGATAIQPDEILAEFFLETPPDGSGAAFFKLGQRMALQCSIVNGACRLAIDPRSGAIQTARVVLGAVSPTVVRAVSAENILVGEKPSERLFQEAGRKAADGCRPIDDLRGSAAYRRDMVCVLASRALREAFENSRQ